MLSAFFPHHQLLEIYISADRFRGVFSSFSAVSEILDSKKDTKMIDFPVKKYILFGKNIIMIFKNVITFFMENNYVF